MLLGRGGGVRLLQLVRHKGGESVVMSVVMRHWEVTVL